MNITKWLVANTSQKDESGKPLISTASLRVLFDEFGLYDKKTHIAVPIKPTNNMLSAAIKARVNESFGRFVRDGQSVTYSRKLLTEAYTAMTKEGGNDLQ